MSRKLIWRRKKKLLMPDSSIEGLAKLGIHITQKQLEDLSTLELVSHSTRSGNYGGMEILILLKILGLLPNTELKNDNSCGNGNENPNNNLPESFWDAFFEGCKKLR